MRSALCHTQNKEAPVAKLFTIVWVLYMGHAFKSSSWIYVEFMRAFLDIFLTDEGVNYTLFLNYFTNNQDSSLK